MKAGSHVERLYQDSEGTKLQELGTSLPGQPLMTAREVAQFARCHEETVRRAYRRGFLTARRFAERQWRFNSADVRDWLERGAPTNG